MPPEDDEKPLLIQALVYAVTVASTGKRLEATTDAYTHITKWLRAGKYPTGNLRGYLADIETAVEAARDELEKLD